jgi:thiamine kinase-like enzyme
LTPELENAVPFIDLWTDRYVDLIERSLPKLSLRSRDWLREVSKEFRRELNSHKVSEVLLHGDLSAEHILVDDEINILGVIDFGDAMIADPALDLAGVRWAYGERLLGQVLEAYTANGCAVDDDFLKRVKFYWKMVPLYLIADGEIFNDGQDFTDGMRQLSARVAADSRKNKQK